MGGANYHFGADHLCSANLVVHCGANYLCGAYLCSSANYILHCWWDHLCHANHHVPRHVWHNWRQPPSVISRDHEHSFLTTFFTVLGTPVDKRRQMSLIFKYWYF